MKQSAAKSLGVAALGAAFAAASAGSAAALTSVPTGLRPGDRHAGRSGQRGRRHLPVVRARAVGLTQGVVEMATQAAPDVPVDTPADPVLGLLGGLPVGGALGQAGLG